MRINAFAAVAGTPLVERSPRLPSWICGEKREGMRVQIGGRLLHGAEAGWTPLTELIVVIETQTN